MKGSKAGTGVVVGIALGTASGAAIDNVGGGIALFRPVADIVTGGVIIKGVR